MPLVAPAVDRHSAASAKFVLFRSLFRRRDDVYPRRFESRTTTATGDAYRRAELVDRQFVATRPNQRCVNVGIGVTSARARIEVSCVPGELHATDPGVPRAVRLP